MTNSFDGIWVQEGRLSIWKYGDAPKSFRGLHITCDKEGGEDIISLLEQLGDISRPRKRSVQISRPTENELKFPNYQNRNIWVPNKLKLVSQLDEESQDVLCWEKSADELTFFVGKNQLNKLLDCFHRLISGESDFSIVSEDKKVRLNFW